MYVASEAPLPALARPNLSAYGLLGDHYIFAVDKSNAKVRSLVVTLGVDMEEHKEEEEGDDSVALGKKTTIGRC